MQKGVNQTYEGYQTVRASEEDINEAVPMKTVYFYFRTASRPHSVSLDEKSTAQEIVEAAMRYLPRKVRDQGVVSLSLWYDNQEEFPAIQRVPPNTPSSAYEIRVLEHPGV